MVELREPSAGAPAEIRTEDNDLQYQKCEIRTGGKVDLHIMLSFYAYNSV